MTPQPQGFQTTALSAYGLALLAILFWSFNVIIARYLADSLSPVQTAFGRWFFALIFILPFTWKRLYQERKILLKHWKVILASSVTGISVMNTLIYQAGETASAVNMSLIGTIGPIFLVIFSHIFLHTHISGKQIIGFICSLSGVLIIISKGEISNIIGFKLVSGDFWMLGMTVFFGIYGVIQIFAPKEIPQVTYLSISILIGTLILLPFFIWSMINKPPEQVSWEAISILAYMGLLPSLLSFLCWDIALKRLGGLKTSLLYYLMPVFSTIEAFFLLQESISKAQIIGGIIVLGGVFITAIHQKHKPVKISRA